MTAETADTDEYKERAAIRHFDGGADQIKANQLALIDMQKRELYEREQRAAAERAAEEKEATETAASKVLDEVGRLQIERDRLGRQMRSETDPANRSQLYDRWTLLNREILKVLKEHRHGHDRRLSG